MPGAVVKVADLLLVLHHVGWFTSLLVLHRYVVLDRFEILSMLETRATGDSLINMMKNTHESMNVSGPVIRYINVYANNLGKRLCHIRLSACTVKLNGSDLYFLPFTS